MLVWLGEVVGEGVGDVECVAAGLCFGAGVGVGVVGVVGVVQLGGVPVWPAGHVATGVVKLTVAGFTDGSV